ncbi:MAG: VOC family protein [Terriglobia bacterium]
MCISELRSDNPRTLRKDHEQPEATSAHRWRYHHIGIPTDVPRPGERYLERFKMYVSGFETSPCGIQWMRFEPDSPVHALIKSVPHIAFEVDDLQTAIEGKEILTAPNSPSEGVMVAMILDSGAPVELLEFRRDLSSGSTRRD